MTKRPAPRPFLAPQKTRRLIIRGNPEDEAEQRTGDDVPGVVGPNADPAHRLVDHAHLVDVHLRVDRDVPAALLEVQKEGALLIHAALELAVASRNAGELARLLAKLPRPLAEITEQRLPEFFVAPPSETWGGKNDSSFSVYVAENEPAPPLETGD